MVLIEFLAKGLDLMVSLGILLTAVSDRDFVVESLF